MTGNAKINGFTQKRAKILLAPLDWGLGHATRCIPIVKELLNLNCEVIIAATGVQKAILEQEFPFLPFVELPGYRVKYGKNRALTLLKIVVSIPKILIRIKVENAWLRAFQERERVDAVISDNRYGLYHADIISVFITHQLLIRTSFGSWADEVLQRVQYRQLNRFSICWVPDLPGNDSLAGELSHPRILPYIPIRYIGTLSRFEKQGPDASSDLLILLSGPEPQRTIFEKMIMGQLQKMPDRPGKTILVRGLPGRVAGRQGLAAAPGLTVYDHLSADTLNKVVCGAKLILSRPGYSSVMDLIKMEKNCIFVPTPGQTEQEYLGDHLAGHNFALCVPQQGFSLAASLEKAKDFPFERPEMEMEGNQLLRTTLGEWVRSLTPVKPY